MYIISACLLGENCKYNGGNNLSENVRDFVGNKNFVAVCPELAGGFSVPRPPVELKKGRAYRLNGNDVTDDFNKGAQLSFSLAKKKAEKLKEEIELAVLKAKSPSCGSGKIYDGSFSGKLSAGNGIFAQLLMENGIKVITEEDIT